VTERTGSATASLGLAIGGCPSNLDTPGQLLPVRGTPHAKAAPLHARERRHAFQCERVEVVPVTLHAVTVIVRIWSML
jgi:hypothetical protein